MRKTFGSSHTVRIRAYLKTVKDVEDSRGFVDGRSGIVEIGALRFRELLVFLEVRFVEISDFVLKLRFEFVEFVLLVLEDVVESVDLRVGHGRHDVEPVLTFGIVHAFCLLDKRYEFRVLRGDFF